MTSTAVDFAQKISQGSLLTDSVPAPPTDVHQVIELARAEGIKGDLLQTVAKEGTSDPIERDMALLRICESLERKPRAPTLLRQKRYKNIFDCLNE